MLITNIFSPRLPQFEVESRIIGINIRQHFSKAVRILLKFDDLNCKVCDDYSPNFRTNSGLYRHYISNHRDETVEYLRDHILTLPPDQIREKIRGIWDVSYQYTNQTNGKKYIQKNSSTNMQMWNYNLSNQST